MAGDWKEAGSEGYIVWLLGCIWRGKEFSREEGGEELLFMVCFRVMIIYVSLHNMGMSDGNREDTGNLRKGAASLFS